MQHVKNNRIKCPKSRFVVLLPLIRSDFRPVPPQNLT
jgi:hypothetical protein